MVIRFDKDYLEELYETGACKNKKYRYQPDIVDRYRRRIDTLISAPNIEVIRTYGSLHYEILKGDKAGISSIRVNKQYRIEFTVFDEGTDVVVTVCNVLELSNHYQK